MGKLKYLNELTKECLNNIKVNGNRINAHLTLFLLHRDQCITLIAACSHGNRLQVHVSWCVSDLQVLTSVRPSAPG